MNQAKVLFFSLLLIACGKTEVREPIIYEGPLREMEDMEMFYSQNSTVKVKMKTPLVHEFKNDDKEFPEGLYLEFYDIAGNLESTLTADHAFYFKEENKWRGRGNVVVKNVIKHEQLNTEELFWTPADQKIFTDKFVTIREQGNVIYGEGMKANQDLSDFEIKHVTGVIEVNED
ncbi:LPS export ABC transporter periplasmic protein LptC [Chryseotalea sanaruensis]|uniref:LPS export ABC transporter periplasmic protein LptC n=1 Tax=Chryseotalea sanaruensis TaxID=2482724 RepID=A0A401U773_9BACT|nr:LPS export ABC transporter periplasmic protein LptC [Chryseotalea sanaruensis]GCC50741.1 LPS export ABC transporter periplasmic protein LptC [Chryseotalea sanaruensis]